MTKIKNTFYSDVYNTVYSAVDELSNARKTLKEFNYLTNDEDQLLRQALHLMYEKLAYIGEDIKKCIAAESDICGYDIYSNCNSSDKYNINENNYPNC